LEGIFFVFNKIITVILCVILFPTMHGMAKAKLFLRANPRFSALGSICAGFYVLDGKNHIKYSGLALAMKNNTVIAMVKKYPVVQKVVTQSLG
jgi:hypothetical protein